jgi:hypothetical protein
MKFLALAVLLCGFSVRAGATTPEYIEIKEVPPARFELTVAGGVALQTGYLTSKRSIGSYVVGVNMLTPGGLFSFEWQGFTADHDTGEFALNDNKSVTVSTVSFIPHVKFYNHEAWSLYLGVGFTNVGLYQTGPEYTTNFGSFTFSGLVRYEITPKWSMQYKTQWYNVVQTSNDQKTSFEVWNHALGVGYNFF